MEIRHATAADLPQIRRMEEQASTAAHWNAAQYDALFANDAPRRIALVARDDLQLIGFLFARFLAGEWEIENIVVDERHKKRGIGTTLVRRLLSEAQAAGAASAILEVRESNAAARRLYEKIGFTSEGRRSSYYRDPIEDAILYRRSLQFCDKIP
jgi:ribosomal-protein-alanine acetyltransferase